MAAVREVNWLELPDHLTALVTDKLSRCDFIRFSAVCKSWLSIFIAHPRRSVLHQLPLLLFPDSEYTTETPIHNIYECIEKRYYSFQLLVPRHMYRGSSYGWVISMWIEIWRGIIVLLLTNPLLPTPNNTIKLPPLKGISHYGPTKIVLSANPALNPNYVVMVTLREHGKLAFFKPADDKADWTVLQAQSKIFDDALYHRDRYYFVDESGTLFNCDLNHPHHPVVSTVLASPPYSRFGLAHDEEGQCLVQLSSGDLLLVQKFRKQHEVCPAPYNTIGFSVYKMNPLVDLEWIQVQNLCGDTVFLGEEYYSSSLRASDFPGCKPNCIYFLDEDEDRYPDETYYMGIFNLEDGSTDIYPYETYYMGIFNLEDGSTERRPTFKRQPFWIQPTPLQQC